MRLDYGSFKLAIRKGTYLLQDRQFAIVWFFGDLSMSLHIVDRENSLRLLQNLVQMFEGPLHEYDFLSLWPIHSNDFLTPINWDKVGPDSNQTRREISAHIAIWYQWELEERNWHSRKEEVKIMCQVGLRGKFDCKSSLVGLYRWRGLGNSPIP